MGPDYYYQTICRRKFNIVDEHFELISFRHNYDFYDVKIGTNDPNNAEPTERNTVKQLMVNVFRIMNLRRPRCISVNVFEDVMRFIIGTYIGFSSTILNYPFCLYQAKIYPGRKLACKLINQWFFRHNFYITSSSREIGFNL